MEQPDNKGQGDNKPSEVNPNLPISPGQEEEVKPEPQDPDYEAWAKETGSLENAYHRVKGSRAEVDKWRQEAEEKERMQKEFREQIATEIRGIYEKDPDTAAKLFGVDINGNPLQPKGEEGQPVFNPEAIKQEVAATVRADIEVNSFYEKNRDKVGTEKDWKAIKDIALSFVGKRDRSDNPYNIQTALMDAMLIRKPELMADKAISDYLTTKANRDSAAMPGDMPSGSSSDDIGLEDSELEMLRAAGATKKIIEGVKRRKAQRLQN
jgi:hypothetical protein